jgi:hypothetical protein
MKQTAPIAAAFALLLATMAAQELPDAPSAQAPAQSQPAAPDRQPKKPGPPDQHEGHERIGWVVPAFGVTNRQDAPPLTPKQKFQLFARSSYDPFVWVAVGLQAGISQAQNSFPEYGQGAAGFGKRYGAALADAVDSNFMANFLYPVLLKQDPRYFRVGQGTNKHRIGHSLLQVVWGRTDKGTHTFNFSNVLGSFTTGAISNAYYPDNDRGLGLTLSRSGISLLYGAAGGLADEFWPDIQRKLSHKQKKSSPSTSGTTTGKREDR